MLEVDWILSTLDLCGFEYRVEGDITKVLGFASLKKVEDNHLFFSVDSIPEVIKSSIVLTNLSHVESDKSNTYIILDDPQLAFYKLMNSYYPRKQPCIKSTAIVTDSVKGNDTITVGEYSLVNSKSIGINVVIGNNVSIHECVKIGDNVTISDNTVIGADGVAWIWNDISGERVIQPQIGYVEIGNEVFIGSNVTIVRGSVNESTIIDNNCLISHGSQIGHGVKINHHTHIANNCTLAGNVVIGSECFIGASATFASQIKIADKTTIGAGAIISKSIENEGATYIGMPARAIPTQNKLNGVPKRK